MTGWQPIETAPVDERVLLWFVSCNPENTYAHTAIFGQVSSYESGKYWDGAIGEYRELEWVTHWALEPEPPS